MKSGAEQIAEERAAHFTRGYKPEHDDGHVNGELAYNAAKLAIANIEGLFIGAEHVTMPELWDLASGKDATRCLVVAGALIAAEIDRLQRAGR